ncbi:non-specific serine/threonine protein kinase [Salvia divinorum]|uniref:non-specific serine/threonine protein kinase n=1 Tax=Salvia divinorum TaxID=28513 RepID=A0ABD1HSY0_SALDI
MSKSVSIFLFLTFFVHATFSLSFDMSPITKSDGGRLNLTGDAYITEEGIQVTTNERDQGPGDRVGRATYCELLHLWDRASQKMADFSTHFSFVIDSFGSNNFGDGLTFFLAPYGSTIKPWAHGSGLGLGNATSPVDPTSLETFVAVEFDTYPNTVIDPPYNGGYVVPHVGIDIGNVSSVATKTWRNNISAGWVIFTGTYNEIFRRDNLIYKVDLRNYLPEYVTVGFSAATGDSFEKNNVKSWNFSSTDVGSAKLVPSPSPQPQAINNGGKDTESPQAQATNKGPKKKRLIFGLGGAAIIFIILASTSTFCFLSRNKKKEPEQEHHMYKGLDLEEQQLSDSTMDNEFEKGNGPKKFSYKELVVATNDFAAENKLGEGGFGSVYKDQSRKYVVHRDIKASNVMLDHNFNAKLGDFGLARLVDHDKNLHSTIPAGTVGYIAPEYSATGKASKETDIFSFGIVLLETVCGRKPVDNKFPGNQVLLMEWVWSLYGAGQLLDAADARLNFSRIEVRKIERLMVVGLWCVHPHSGRRPSIRQVVRALTSEDPLPSLPLAMPKAVYDDNTASKVAATNSNHVATGISGSSSLTISSAGSTSDLLPNE